MTLKTLITAIAMGFFLFPSSSLKAQNTLTFTEAYTSGVNPTAAQQTHWTNFKASLTSNYCYSQVHLYGSNSPAGFTITNPSDVATIAANIRQDITFQLASGGHNWQYCSNDLRIDGQAVNFCNSCDWGDCLRPMSGFGGNWGGLNGNTCGASSQTITLEFTYSAPVVNLGNDTMVCGNSLLLNAGSSGSAYLWQDGSSNQTYTATTSGTYYVLVSDSCGNSTDTIQVTFYQAPAQPSNISGSTSLCAASSNTYTTSPVAGATSYTWTLPLGWSGSSDSASINTTAGSAGGTISITANNNCGSSTAQTLVVTVTQIPSQPGIISGAATVCPGATEVYTISNVAGATSYSWTLPPGWTGSSATDSITATTGNSGGAISVNAINNCGISTPQSLSVNATTPDTSITVNGITLTSNATPASYQWVTCPSMAIINGATGQSYTPSQNGDYALIVTQNGCTDTSSCYQVTSVGLQELSNSTDFIVYPNPATQHAVIKFSNGNNQVYTLTIFNRLGALLQTIAGIKTGMITIETENLSAGVYYFHLQSANRIITGQLIVGE